mgnify:CR=1 FL=1|jgi:hypothetical protein
MINDFFRTLVMYSLCITNPTVFIFVKDMVDKDTIILLEISYFPKQVYNLPAALR